MILTEDDKGWLTFMAILICVAGWLYGCAWFGFFAATATVLCVVCLASLAGFAVRKWHG